MEWLVVPATVLQVAGIGIAMWGVDELSRELFPGRPLPHRAAWRWIRRRLRPGQSDTVSGTAHLVSDVGLTARGLVTMARPADNAALKDWIAYFDSRFENVAQQLAWVRDDLRDTTADIDQRLEKEATARAEGDRQRGERLRVALGGEGGSGLIKAFWGLSVTAVGVILQGIAGAAG